MLKNNLILPFFSDVQVPPGLLIPKGSPPFTPEFDGVVNI
jgi:hypothetical protein